MLPTFAEGRHVSPYIHTQSHHSPRAVSWATWPRRPASERLTVMAERDKRGRLLDSAAAVNAFCGPAATRQPPGENNAWADSRAYPAAIAGDDPLTPRPLSRHRPDTPGRW
jgi:hypothetical protein